MIYFIHFVTLYSQGASAVDPELAEAPGAGGAPQPPPQTPMERQLSQLSLKGEREKVGHGETSLVQN